MSNKQNDIHLEMLEQEFATTLNNVRDDELGLSLKDISIVVAKILDYYELKSLAMELLDRMLEKHPLGICQLCKEDLTQEEFDKHKGLCFRCHDKYIEDKINTEIVEGLKPDNETDF
jgi:uncharacterized CHY-type Zn-finger protein